MHNLELLCAGHILTQHIKYRNARTRTYVRVHVRVYARSVHKLGVCEYNRAGRGVCVRDCYTVPASSPQDRHFSMYILTPLI